MNIIEAMKSGRKFKRQGSTCWFDPPSARTLNELYLDERDILADDWEIEEESITITKSEFLRKWAAALKENHFEFNGHNSREIEYLTQTTVVSCLFKKLGFDNEN